MNYLANTKAYFAKISSYLRKPRTLIAVAIASVLTIVILVIFNLNKPATPVSETSSSVHPGSCLVLEEKFCKYGYAVEVNGEFVGVGFMLPESTPVFADTTGKAQKTDYSLMGQDYPAIESNPTSGDTEATIVLRSSSITATGVETKKGEKIASLTEESLGINGDYNLIVFFSKAGKVDKTLTLTNFSL